MERLCDLLVDAVPKVGFCLLNEVHASKHVTLSRDFEGFLSNSRNIM